MIRVAMHERKELSERFGIRRGDKNIILKRLTKQYFTFLPGKLVIINKSRKWYTIIDGASTMSGPLNKDIKKCL
jgi:hypothetical protein